MKKLLFAIAGISMASTPVVAAPTQVNPAAKLSVAKALRSSHAGDKKSELAGGGLLIGLVAAAAVIAGIVVVADSGGSSASN